FGILTNGILYRFYTDLVEPNKMDEKPFLEFNLADLRDNQIEELKKFHKSYFDVDNIITTASELKYTNELKTLINNEFFAPSENFVKHFARQVYPGMITQKVLDQFTNLTRKSISHYISDLITERLKSALTKESENNAAEPEVTAEVSESISKIVTTAEELECFLIIKSILRQRVEVSRIAYRDAQSYFSILLDDNNRKTICRLYLNGTKKQLGIFDEQKKETKFELLSLDDLFTYSNQLVAAIDFYEKVKETV
ncbi:MAG: restriction endonuclease, partial [Flavobacteriales bacterium]